MLPKLNGSNVTAAMCKAFQKSKCSFPLFSLENLLPKKFLWTEPQEPSLFYIHFGAFPF